MSKEDFEAACIGMITDAELLEALHAKEGHLLRALDEIHSAKAYARINSDWQQHELGKLAIRIAGMLYETQQELKCVVKRTGAVL